MRFDSTKKLESEIYTFTKKVQLNDNITLLSQGKEIFLENLGSTMVGDAYETVWMGIETADSLRVRYNNDNNNIEVLEVHLTRD